MIFFFVFFNLQSLYSFFQFSPKNLFSFSPFISLICLLFSLYLSVLLSPFMFIVKHTLLFSFHSSEPPNSKSTPRHRTLIMKKSGGSVKSSAGFAKNNAGSVRSSGGRERESLLREISELELQIKALGKRNLSGGVSVSDTISNIAGLLQVLKDKNLSAERATAVEEKILEEEQQKEVINILEVEKKKRKALRVGSEGEEVKVMQEALQTLGFYSGEEDMEYSSFSSGTERSVKTWQATVGTHEDGIMTSELLERLYMEQRFEDIGTDTGTDQKGTILTVPSKEDTNGAAIASVTEISEIQQTFVKEEGVTQVDVSQKRFFLLGDNQWEEPSRLAGRDSQVVGSKTRETTTRCLTCRGEGHLVCTECDGTGEPNIKPQFLEWVGEGTKYPYCEGLGYTICDGCEGKTAA